MAKWTRAEVMDVASMVRCLNSSVAHKASDMLRDLAPPDEPRAWQVGDLLRYSGRNCRIAEIDGDNVMLKEIDGGWMGWERTADIADAVRLKLVPVEDGR